ncbi:MAG TPA: nuclear transport factor 2 family protein [Steroidobacteraceae bacterium]|nr:nuclear transport factor 2 family protein [Steroidobacteraceae bacterium]
MTEFRVSRRAALGTGIGALAMTAGLPPAASARTWAGLSTANRGIIRRYYGAWERKDWQLMDMLLADGFTFTSAAPDDHISKTTFKTRCWDTQSALIDRFDLERVFGAGDEAFVKYICRTKSGNSFRNVEYLRLKGGKVAAIECYFGGAGYPSAANAGHT